MAPHQTFGFGAGLAGFVACVGAVACWGATPHGEDVVPAGTYQAVATGSIHVCAIRTDGTIACWGDARGQPPDAATTTYSSMAIKDKHTCAIATDGTITCWPRSPKGVSWST